jgi:hypothetical protein
MNNVTVSNPEEFLWCQRFRPSKIEDCILPDRIKQTLKDIISKGEIPNLLFPGSQGCGKCLDPQEKISLMVSDEIYEKLLKFL